MTARNARKMVHVIHLSTVHSALDSRILEREARTLSEAGYRLSVIARHPARETLNGIDIVPVRTSRTRFDRLIVSPWSALRQCLALKPNIVHIHDPELIPVGLVLRLLRRTVIYDVHEDLPKQIIHKDWIPRVLRTKLGGAIAWLEPLPLRRFNLVVVVSPPVRDRLSAHNVTRTLLLRNFPRRDDYAHPPAIAVDQPSIDIHPDHVRIVYCGAITGVRGAREMVAAIGNCDPSLHARLILAGPCASDLLTELQGMQGWAATTYLGRIPPAEVPALLASSYLGLAVLHPIPNYVGETPTKLFEYMAAGLPVICSDFSPYDVTVASYRCGQLLDPYDIAAITRAIENLIRNPQLAREMGARGVRAVHEVYNWETESVGLITAYDQLSNIG